jgi:hypothetical protein
VKIVGNNIVQLIARNKYNIKFISKVSNTWTRVPLEEKCYSAQLTFEIRTKILKIDSKLNTNYWYTQRRHLWELEVIPGNRRFITVPPDRRRARNCVQHLLNQTFLLCVVLTTYFFPSRVPNHNRVRVSEEHYLRSIQSWCMLGTAKSKQTNVAHDPNST